MSYALLHEQGAGATEMVTAAVISTMRRPECPVHQETCVGLVSRHMEQCQSHCWGLGISIKRFDARVAIKSKGTVVSILFWLNGSSHHF
jgi:hypothetical protein